MARALRRPDRSGRGRGRLTGLGPTARFAFLDPAAPEFFLDNAVASPRPVRQNPTVTTHQRVADRVAAAIAERVVDGSALIAIDGPGGAGKTMLAEAVAEILGGPDQATVVHGDDFYRPMPPEERLLLGPQEGYHQYFDWQRLRDQVIVPLASGRAANYQRYDWATGALAPGEIHHVPRSGAVIVEGVYTALPELARYYNLTVHVDTPRDICIQRLTNRGHDHGPENWIKRWRAAEDHYLTTTQLSSRVDLTIKGC